MTASENAARVETIAEKLSTAKRDTMLYVENENFLGRRPRLDADKDRNDLRKAGLIVSAPPNAGRIFSRSGKGYGWLVTDLGREVAAYLRGRT